MSVDAKKVAAALAAVDMFLKEQAAKRAERAAPPPGYPSLWAISGRQWIMNSRFLVTARMWK